MSIHLLLEGARIANIQLIRHALSEEEDRQRCNRAFALLPPRAAVVMQQELAARSAAKRFKLKGPAQ